MPESAYFVKYIIAKIVLDIEVRTPLRIGDTANKMKYKFHFIVHYRRSGENISADSFESLKAKTEVDQREEAAILGNDLWRRKRRIGGPHASSAG